MNLQALTRFLQRPGDTQETLELKTTLALFTFSVVLPVFFLTGICFWWNLPVLRTYGLVLLGYYALSMGLFFWFRRYVEWFYYVNQLAVLSITLFTVARLGGILHSGGLLFAALAIVIFSFVYPRIRLAIFAFSVFSCAVVALALVQPWLKPAPEILRPNINLIFTVMNLLWILVFIVLVIFYVFQKRAKDEKEKTRHLRELDSLKTHLYTNITHQFRTPLTIILGATDPPAQSTIPLEGRGGRLDLIRRNANRLLRLVNQMLALSRLESGAMPINKIRGDILLLLRYFLDSSRSMAERKNVRLHFLSSLPALEMDYDPDKLEDIVSNLLSNAIKFTPTGGDVYLTVDYFEKNGDTPQFLLKIRDTGIGIPAEKLGLIFERFFQVDSENAHVEEGSGIGLTLVKEYTKLLGGNISVQSTPGKGTEFLLTLPVSREAKLLESKLGAPHQNLFGEDKHVDDEMDFEYALTDPKSGRPVLLLVEDNAELRHYLQSITAPFYDVQIARNGEEGIERALEIVPDVIVSDVMMPVKDGYELCLALKNDFRTNHIPIILLTARADAESKLTGLEKGADAYMAKPFQAKELLLRLRKLIELREKLRIKYSLARTIAADESAAPGLDEIFMRDLHRILEKKHADENFGIEQLCTDMHISRVQLHRKLVALSGQSASHFINSFRLEKAARLLRTTREPVSKIAYEVGFRDANYFAKVFTKAYGAAPSEWRSGGKQ